MSGFIFVPIVHVRSVRFLAIVRNCMSFVRIVVVPCRQFHRQTQLVPPVIVIVVGSILEKSLRKILQNDITAYSCVIDYSNKLGTAQVGTPLESERAKCFEYAKGHYCEKNHQIYSAKNTRNIKKLVIFSTCIENTINNTGPKNNQRGHPSDLENCFVFYRKPKETKNPK